jgi:hypothetical protein
MDNAGLGGKGLYLHIMNIDKYAGQLSDAQIDGALLKELDEQILIDEFGFKRFEAIDTIPYFILVLILKKR